MSAKKKKKLHEGKTKTLYETEAPEQLILAFRDDAPLANNKVLMVEKKGEINAQISALLFRYLESYHIPTHLIDTAGKDSLLVRTLDIIPLALIVHNQIGAALAKRTNLKEGKILERALLEYRFKEQARSEEFASRNDVLAAGFISSPDLHILERYANKINVVLKSFFARRGFILENAKLEFGRYKNRMMLGDEISLDNCFLLEEKSGEKVFPTRAYSDAAALQRIYHELGSRILSTNPRTGD